LRPAWLHYLFLVLLLASIFPGCRKSGQTDKAPEPVQPHQQTELQASRQHNLELTVERDSLQQSLETVTRELVEAKIERDKLVVELRACTRQNSYSQAQ